ncbi:adenylosuccinate lyase [Mycoplasmatota bacterium]|nr:adenylosuccinate lyase [Mycoplasmatota bacterium]
MITRYSRKEMKDIWTEQKKFEAYLKVEILTLEAWNKLGVIPLDDLKMIQDNADFSIERIYEIEKKTKHDIIAFTRSVSEFLGSEKKWVHYGLTSTDVVDTANGYIYKQANDILRDDLVKLMDVLREQANKYKNTPCIGRTHGIHADITSFGLKFALWYEDMKRNLARLDLARRDVEAGKISGAVGNFANTPVFVQDYVCEQLGIESSNISTQTLQRDRHANYMSVLALIATELEKMAVELRHLQRTEVHEVQEYFDKGQKGSSAMPHKKNPISSENITGCARVIRGYMNASFDNIALWHERDISHSSVERIIVPDATVLLDYALSRFTNVVKNLIVHEENMLNNIYKTNGVIFAQRVMTALINKDLSREEAYDMVQPIAMKTMENKSQFLDELLISEVSKYLSKDELKACFDLEYYLKSVDTIFSRVGI